MKKICSNCHGHGVKIRRGNHFSIFETRTCYACMGAGETMEDTQATANPSASSTPQSCNWLQRIASRMRFNKKTKTAGNGY